MTVARTYASSIVVTAVAVLIAFVYAGGRGVLLAVVLGVLEISLSFDNAVINATVLAQMTERWQQIFLTVGMVIAVFGMRLLFPLLVVWLAAGLGPSEALRLALHPPPDGASRFADGRASYETILTGAHPQIAAFGGAFLLLLFLTFVLSPQEHTWLGWVERPLARVGRIRGIGVVIAAGAVLGIAEWVAPATETATVLGAGLLGVVVYLVVDGLGQAFGPSESSGAGAGTAAALATGKAAFFLFVYLEVLDASFSFDGVIGAFAITADPILIMLGLGGIGAMFVRSITIHLVREDVLGSYRYLGHGAHWAIGALAVILLVSITRDVPQAVTGGIGVVIIGASVVSSIAANRAEVSGVGASSRAPT